MNGEKSLDESSGKIDEVHTYLYDFPDPIPKVGVQPRKCINRTHRFAHLRGRVKQVTRNADAKTHRPKYTH